MRRLCIGPLVVGMLGWLSCLGVAYDRANSDLKVGIASADGLSVQVQVGLASVREVNTQTLHLWAQAPQLQITITVPGNVSTLLIKLDNALADANLTVLTPGSNVSVEPLASLVPTEKRWQLSGLVAGDITLAVMVPDALAWEPWRFAVFADVQERINDVQDLFGRIKQEPDLRFAIISGDLTEDGSARELLRFQTEMKMLGIPAYATLGNHELGTRDDLFHEYFGRGNSSFVFRNVQFTLLDSASATLAPKAYEWLGAWLQQGREGIHFVFMHIPPLDPVGTRNGGFASRLEASKLLSLLAEGNVDMTVYGHVHSYYAFRNAGIPAFITGGGGSLPDRFDGLGRHFLVVDVDPGAAQSRATMVRVD